MLLEGTRGCPIPVCLGGCPQTRVCRSWGGSLSNPPTPSAPRGAGEGAQPGPGSAGALQPAWPSLLQRDLHTNPGSSHEPRPPAATSAGHTPGSPEEEEEMAAGDEKRHLLSEGTGGYGGARGGPGCRAPSLLCGSRVGSGRGTGSGGEHSGCAALSPKPPRAPQCSPRHRFAPQVLRGACAEGRARRSAGTGALPGAGDTAGTALPHAWGRRPPRAAAAGPQEALPGRWHLPLLHGGGSRG